MTSRPRTPAPTFEELSAYIDNELGNSRMMELDRWLSSNPGAAAELARLRQMEKGLRRLIDESEKMGAEDAEDLRSQS